MSNVQLSSSAVERLAAHRRTFPLHARTGACRNLFGPVDHDELNREMKSTLREISDRDQRRWNFNFEAHTPLPGDYEWEETPVDTQSPVFYQDSVQVGKSRIVDCIKSCTLDLSPAQDCPSQDLLPVCKDRLTLTSSESSTPSSCPTEINQENRADKLNSGKPSTRKAPCTRRNRTATTDPTATHITDFFAKRKRPADTKTNNESTCMQHSSSAIPVEQTPRKRIR